MSTRSVSLQEAEGHLNELIAWLDQGEDVEIVRGSQPKIRLVVDKPRRERQFGQHRGQVRMHPDFDAPLDDAFWLGDA